MESQEYFSVDPNEWQNLHLHTRARRRGRRQMLLVGLPLLLMIFWLTIVFFFRFSPSQTIYFDATAPFPSRLSSLFWHALLWVNIASVIVLGGVHFLLTTGLKFVVELHRPSSEAQISNRIWHRFMGWYGFLKTQNYMQINNVELTPADHWSTWLGGPAYMIIFDGFSAYLERGNCFSRVVGPGFPIPYLDARETIKAIVDLRPQTRSSVITTWAKDGIKINLTFRVEFQIGTGTSPESTSAKGLYPFDRLAVQKAVEYCALRIREGKMEKSDWQDAVVGKIKGIISHYISGRGIDEVFLLEDGKQILNHEVLNQLVKHVNRELMDVGTHVNTLQIVYPGTPQTVRNQLIDVRSATMDNLVVINRSRAQAYEISKIEDVRSDAELKLIVEIAENIRKVGPSHFQEPVLLTLANLLNRGLKDPGIQAYMTRESLDALRALKDIIE